MKLRKVTNVRPLDRLKNLKIYISAFVRFTGNKLGKLLILGRIFSKQTLKSTAKKSIFGVILVRIFSIRTEYGKIRSISPYAVQMRENTDQNYTKYAHFSRSGRHGLLVSFVLILQILSFFTGFKLSEFKRNKRQFMNFEIRYWRQLAFLCTLKLSCIEIRTKTICDSLIRLLRI